MAKQGKSSNKQLNKKKVKQPQRRGRGPKRDERDMDLKSDVKSEAGADNSPQWYANNAYLLKDAASLAYANPAGMPIRIPGVFNCAETAISFAGVCAIETLPAVGVADAATDPINTASRNVYSWVRHDNSGHSNYEAPNEMMYLVGMDNLYSFYSFGARAYGLIRTFAQRNRFLPEGLFVAMGLDYNDFMLNQVQLRFFLNTFAERVGSLCIPGDMSYMLRHMWLYQNVFADSFVDKAQLYIYTPGGFLQYDPVGHGSGTSSSPALKLKPFPGTNAGMKVAEFIRFGLDLLESIMRQEDFNIMSGDILKAFGPDKIWRLIPIHEDYEVIPVFSEEVLSQIENAVACPLVNPAVDTELVEWIYEDVDATTATSILKTAYPQIIGKNNTMKSTHVWSTSGGVLVNMHKMDCSPEDNIVATRLQHVVAPAQNWAPNPTAVLDYKAKLLHCGSEIVNQFKYVKRATSDLAWVTRYFTNTAYSEVHTELPYLGFDEAVLGEISVFGQHPILYVYDPIGNGAVRPKLLRFVGDMENYTYLTPDVLARMHETALLSEFAVPLMGSFAHKE